MDNKGPKPDYNITPDELRKLFVDALNRKDTQAISNLFCRYLGSPVCRKKEFDSCLARDTLAGVCSVSFSNWEKKRSGGK